MLEDEILKSVLALPNAGDKYVSSRKVINGKIIPPKQHLLLLSADDWEEFVVEWGHFQKTKYHLVTRLGGANDYGIDVACFYTDKGFHGEWDNFQCKYYKGDPLTPGTAIPEIGKILWHIFNKKITTPKRYYFFAPKDCGASLKKLLLDSAKIKRKLFDEWDNWCANTITSKLTVKLEGLFLTFVEQFDFSIFQYKPVLEVIEEHSDTPYYAVRFGGGLKDRPEPNEPPEHVDDIEVKYVERLNDAYADHKKIDTTILKLSEHPELEAHFIRQREAFYFAESLRTFARDSVPPGTFEDLQNDMLDGVIDTLESNHKDGFARLKEVMKESKSVPLDANGLFQVIRVKDRYGICHQLANSEKIKWVKNDD
jgi:hypothetical protein